MANAQCPICFKEDKLVEHHWWEDKAHTIGHIRPICRCCNMALRTINDDTNHVLPNWDIQIEHVQKYMVLKNLVLTLYTILKMAKRANPNTPCHPAILQIANTINPDKTHCPKCGSIWVYHRTLRRQYICRICRHIWADEKTSNPKHQKQRKKRRKAKKRFKQGIDKTLVNKLYYTQMRKDTNTEKPRCPKCKSAWTYHRIYREEWYCRTCTHTWPFKEIDEQYAPVPTSKSPPSKPEEAQVATNPDTGT